MNAKAIELLNKIGTKKYSEDSDWQHLLELISDGKDMGDCRLCHQLIMGPSYTCRVRWCGFLLHKSCVEQPHSQDMEHKHSLYKENHMIFIKELEKVEKVVCSFCKEVVSSSAYKCSIPGCNFLIHQSCVDTPLELRKNPMHSHSLRLQGPLEDQHCDLCSKVCNICFSYQCSGCNFAIHIKCASLCLVSVENCYPHEFITMRENVGQYTCQACGQQNDEILYLCRNCRLLIHWRCAKTYQCNIKTEECDHSLTLRFSLPPIECKCKVCTSLVDNRYAAYICQICDYVAHLWCAYAILEDKMETLQEIENHFSHPEHKLILSSEEPKYDHRCLVCMDYIISPSFYSCAPCKVFLHKRCGMLPPKIKPFFDDQKTLTLFPKISSTSKSCDGCQRIGFLYCDDEVFWKLDVQCSLLRKNLKHKGHQHRLFFDMFTQEMCNACNGGDYWLFRCFFCNFNLCSKCATYPLQTWHRDHEHLLKLTCKAEDNSGEYYCLICEQKRNSSNWFYYCLECNFAAHFDCAYPTNRFITI